MAQNKDLVDLLVKMTEAEVRDIKEWVMNKMEERAAERSDREAELAKMSLEDLDDELADLPLSHPERAKLVQLRAERHN